MRKQRQVVNQRNKYRQRDKKLRNSRPTKQEVFKSKKKELVYCSSCGGLLTSPRSIRLGIGQRCKWRRDGRPTRKRSSNVSQGMPISDVKFIVSGGKEYVQLKLGEC